MSSTAFIALGGYPLFISQNYYDKWYFKNKDKVIKPVHSSDRNVAIWGALEEGENDYIEMQYAYISTVKIIKRRLKIEGYTRETLQQDFTQSIKKRESFLLELSNDFADEGQLVARDTLPIEDNSLEEWLKALKVVIQHGITEHNFRAKDQILITPKVREIIIPNYWREEDIEHNLGFPVKSLNSLAVAMLECLNDEDECILDVTELVRAGWTNDFEDDEEVHSGTTKFYDVFLSSLDDTKSLIDLSPANPTLARLLFANVITAMETYLSDTLKKEVLNKDAIKKRYVEMHAPFAKSKIEISQIFNKMKTLNTEISDAIDQTSFHDINKVPFIFRDVLDTHFEEAYLPELKAAVRIRHDIIHRSGKSTAGAESEITMHDVSELIENMIASMSHIDKQIIESLLDHPEDDYEGAIEFTDEE